MLYDLRAKLMSLNIACSIIATFLSFLFKYFLISSVSLSFSRSATINWSLIYKTQRKHFKLKVKVFRAKLPIEGTVLTIPGARDEIAKSAWPSEPREGPTRQGTGSIFISRSLKTLRTVLAKREKHRRRAKARGEKEGKNGSWGGGGGGEGTSQAPLLFVSRLSRFPSSSRLAQSRELHLYLPLSCRPVLYKLSLLISHERLTSVY